MGKVTGEHQSSRIDTETGWKIDPELYIAEKRLDSLLKLNKAFQRAVELSERDRRPISGCFQLGMSSERIYSIFGLSLGVLPTVAIFGRFILAKLPIAPQDTWILLILLLCVAGTGSAGYVTGRLVGKIVREFENLPWLVMLPSLVFIGLLWGMIAGGAGGVFILIFGAIFGAAIGGAVGAVALPAFTVFHRSLKSGDHMDPGRALPLAIGIAGVIAAGFLGFPSG